MLYRSLPVSAVYKERTNNTLTRDYGTEGFL